VRMRWIVAAALFPRMAEAAMKYDSLMSAARAVGLTDDEASETFTTWQRAYQATLDPLPWRRVERAMVLRAMGEEWRP